MALTPTCPAASVVHRGTGDSFVLCGVLAQDYEKDRDPHGRREGLDWHIFSERDDPSVVYGRCCAHFTRCEIWRAERERQWAERERFADAVEQPPAGTLDELLATR